PELPPEGGTKWRNLTWPFGAGDSKINSVCPSLPADRVCQQPGLSLWVPFQNAATAVTNLYKESVDAHQRSFDLGIQIGYQRRNKDVLAWVKKRRRTIRREDLISFLCGKVPPPRNSRAPPRLTVVSPNRATSTETSSSVETDLQPFREAIALHAVVYTCLRPAAMLQFPSGSEREQSGGVDTRPGLSGAMASISVRSSTPGSPTHVSSGSNASRRRNGLHDVDLNTFISEEMALHLDNGGTRKRTSAQCGDVITDSPTHKRNRMI
uniref:HUWE1 associated protein modifying stress responses n=1 Tax=Ficedula albicollis TaxID=59894 RepID=A0A803V7K8_FICAL